MTDEPQHTTDNARATDDAQTESETGDGEARLDAVEQRVNDHQAILDGLKEHLGGDGDGSGPVATRRGVLTAGGVLGLLGLGAGTASADPSGQIGTSNDPLQDLYTETLHGHSGTLTLKDDLDLDSNKLTNTATINGGITGNTELSGLTGDGLTIGSNSLKLDIGSGLTFNSGSLETSESSKWTDGSSGSSWLEPSDSGDTKLEGIDTIESNDQDSALTITQDSNSSDAIPDDLTLETKDASANNAVGNIVLDADSDNASPADIVFNTSTTERARVNGNGLNVDTLTDNGTGSVSMGNTLDLNGNDIEDSGTTIWDTSNSYIPTARLESDSVTVTAGDGLKNGGAVSLGSSTTLDVEPADFAGTLLSDDGSDNLQVDEGSISHDNIDQTTVNTADHHTRPSAGTGLTEDGSNNFDIASGGVTGTEIDLSTIAGQNLTVDTTNDELDAQTPALAENDSDNLLETTGGEDGIDVTTIRVTNLDDTNGNGHLTLTGGGPLDLNQPLDTNGNGIQSNTSVSVDIDADGGGSGETFTVTKNGGGTTLLTVNQGGEVDINSGNLDLSGNKLTDSNGGLTIEGSSGNGVTINTDGSNRALSLGVPSSDGTDTAGGNFVAGHPNNAVNNGAVGAIIGGGGNDGTNNENTVEDDYGTVSGGEGNQAGSTGSDETNAKWATVSGGNANTASAVGATVSGGDSNTASGDDATVGGGDSNTASGNQATVAGGNANTADGHIATVGGGNINTASGSNATVGGGVDNTASGNDSTVPGGDSNTASGTQSFAAGQYAEAANSNAFVWNDGSGASDSDGSSSDQFSSSTSDGTSGVTGTNTFHVKSTGGVRIITDGANNDVTYIGSGGTGWSNTSTRTAKTNVETVDPQRVLAGVESMPVSTWEYKNEDGDGKGVRFIGPMAEDFHEPFEIGDNDTAINSINADGVAFAAIQALSEKLDEREEHVEGLEADLDDKDDRIDELEAENEQLRERNAELEDRLAAVEAELGIDATASQEGVADD